MENIADLEPSWRRSRLRLHCLIEEAETEPQWCGVQGGPGAAALVPISVPGDDSLGPWLAFLIYSSWFQNVIVQYQREKVPLKIDLFEN